MNFLALKKLFHYIFNANFGGPFYCPHHFNMVKVNKLKEKVEWGGGIGWRNGVISPFFGCVMRNWPNFFA